jgi:hypothetical protein
MTQCDPVIDSIAGRAPADQSRLPASDGRERVAGGQSLRMDHETQIPLPGPRVEEPCGAWDGNIMAQQPLGLSLAEFSPALRTDRDIEAVGQRLGSRP